MGEYLKTLDGLTSGRYVVITFSGTQHLVDLDKKTAIRRGAPGHEWGKERFVVHPDAILPGTNLKFVGHFEPVTPDGAPFHFVSIQNATVGERMRLDNADEWRLTSQIQSIEEF